MSNPTIYRFPKKIIENPDGTTTEIEKSLRKNKDISMIVKIKDMLGYTKVVYHLVYDAHGKIVHGPHEEPGSRAPDYRGKFSFKILEERK